MRRNREGEGIGKGGGMHYHIHALMKGWFAMHSGQNVRVVNGQIVKSLFCNAVNQSRSKK